jgi:hypothetical protein
MRKPCWYRKAVLVVIFESRQALIETMAGRVSDWLDIGHAALIVRAEGAEPVIVNNNVTAHEGAIAGALLGASMLALGVVQQGALDLPRLGALLAVLLSGLAGAAVGILVGYFVAQRVGFGFSPQLLQSTAHRLAAGQVALVLQVRQSHVARLEDEFAQHPARVELVH